MTTLAVRSVLAQDLAWSRDHRSGEAGVTALYLCRSAWTSASEGIAPSGGLVSRASGSPFALSASRMASSGDSRVESSSARSSSVASMGCSLDVVMALGTPTGRRPDITFARLRGRTNTRTHRPPARGAWVCQDRRQAGGDWADVGRLSLAIRSKHTPSPRHRRKGRTLEACFDQHRSSDGHQCCVEAAARRHRRSRVHPGGYAPFMDTPDSPNVAEQRLSILSEIGEGRSVTVRGDEGYHEELRRSLVDDGCSVYLGTSSARQCWSSTIRLEPQGPRSSTSDSRRFTRGPVNCRSNVPPRNHVGVSASKRSRPASSLRG
jgi:hypothetical protein